MLVTVKLERKHTHTHSMSPLVNHSLLQKSTYKIIFFIFYFAVFCLHNNLSEKFKFKKQFIFVLMVFRN